MNGQPFKILYQDDHFVAINKPSGILVHRTKIRYARNDGFVLQQLRDQIRQRLYPVHRLDKQTSGVLIFGFSGADAKAMNLILQSGEAEKRYLAIVRGYTAATGRIDHPVKKEKSKEAVAAVSEYLTLDQTELPFPVGRYETARYSLVEVRPLSGRTHQIRKHFAHIFHPVIGDGKYGDRFHNRFFVSQYDCGRLLLHAKGLRFMHPFLEKEVEIEAEIPADFRQVRKALWPE
jgi:tRNA pseudouridine65 synthase